VFAIYFYIVNIITYFTLPSMADSIFEIFYYYF
jgi:hypothetical protein